MAGRVTGGPCIRCFRRQRGQERESSPRAVHGSTADGRGGPLEPLAGARGPTGATPETLHLPRGAIAPDDDRTARRPAGGGGFRRGAPAGRVPLSDATQ